MKATQPRALLAARAVVAAIVLPTGLIAATIYFGTGSIWPERPAKSPSTVVVWGDAAFTTRRGFEMWLKANGRDYGRWSKRHPAAAALLNRPRKARPVARSTPSPDVASAVSVGHRISYALLGLGGGIAAFLSIAVVRRLPRVAIPAVAFGGYGASPGRIVAGTVLRLPRARLPIPRPRTDPAVRRARRLLSRVRGVSASCVSAVGKVFLVFREVERFDVALGAISVALGLAAGILVPFLLAR